MIVIKDEKNIKRIQFPVPDLDKCVQDGKNIIEVTAGAINCIVDDLSCLYDSLADYYGYDTLITILETSLNDYVIKYRKKTGN